MLDQFSFTIYVNGRVVSSSQFISGVLSSFLVNYSPARC